MTAPLEGEAMSIAASGLMAAQSVRDEAKREIAAQHEFEQTIRHLTPERQAELLAIRQIALEAARIARRLR